MQFLLRVKLRATFIRIFAATISWPTPPSGLVLHRSAVAPICYSLSLNRMAKISSKKKSSLSLSEKLQDADQLSNGDGGHRNLRKRQKLSDMEIVVPNTDNVEQRSRNSKVSHTKISTAVDAEENKTSGDSKKSPVSHRSRKSISRNKSNKGLEDGKAHRRNVNKPAEEDSMKSKLQPVGEMSTVGAGTSRSSQIFQTLKDRLEKLRNGAKAVGMSKYMRNQFDFFGVNVPQIKAACTDLWKDIKVLTPKELRCLAQLAWDSRERELHYFAVSLLEREKFRLYEDVDSPSQRAQQTLSFIKSFLTTPNRAWWDSVDPLSANVVGPLVQKYPDDLLSEMDKWNVSSDFWLSRVSILYQLKFKNTTDVDRLFRYCLQRAEDKEFFLQKAIGWALREYAKTNPGAVYGFVKKHEGKLSTLSKREALKHKKS